MHYVRAGACRFIRGFAELRVEKVQLEWHLRMLESGVMRNYVGWLSVESYFIVFITSPPSAWLGGAS